MLQANIFFLVTGIAVIIFTLLLCVAIYHVIKILRSVRRIIDRIEAGSEAIADDISQLRKYVAEKSFLSSFVNVFLGRRRRTPKTRSKLADNDGED